MYRIKGRLNTAIDLEYDEKLRKNCIRVMSYYDQAEREDFVDLTQEQMDRLERFWKPYEFIYKVDPRVHRFYMNVTGKFDERYIPEDLQKYHMSRYFMDQDYVEAFKDKNFTELILRELNTPKTLVHKIAGAFRDSSYNPITVKEAVDIIMEQKKETDGDKIAVMKPAMGTSRGSGVRPLGRAVTRNEVRRLLETWRPDIEVQAIIRQHPLLASIHEKSVNTIRVLSMLSGDRCEIISIVLRAGRSGVFVDGGNRGGINCGITLDGKMKGPFHDKWANTYETHPETGFNPEGVQIPGFDRLIDTIKTQHLHFPQLRLISWDFSIDENENPIFIEWNMKGDTQLHQYNNGPLYGERTGEVLDEFFSHAYREVEQNGVLYHEYIDHAEAAGLAEPSREIIIGESVHGKPVTKIAGKAFSHQEEVEYVSVGKSVSEIGYLAFSGCSSLLKAELPDSLEVVGESAFNNCRSLKSVSPLKGVTHIMARAFQNCASLEKVIVGDEVKALGCRAFSGCKSLLEFSAGTGLARIEDRAFQGCSRLEKADFQSKEITVLARGFLNCESLEAEPIREKCRFQGINCFKGCKDQNNG